MTSTFLSIILIILYKKCFQRGQLFPGEGNGVLNPRRGYGRGDLGGVNMPKSSGSS